MLRWLRVLAALTKLRISAMATLTTATGFVVFARRSAPEIWTSLVGTLLVAAAASTFNQLQEQRYDARMDRTRDRPLPTGQVERPTALVLAVTLAGLGFASLASVPANPLVVLALGGLALLWYNGLYTYLKRVTAFAVVPGALIGAVPPAIGWCAAGGSLADPALWLLSGFFFVWQIPHFWLLALRHDADYRRSGWPVLTESFAPAQLRRVTFAWIASSGVLALLAAVLVLGSLLWLALLTAASLWLVAGSLSLLRGSGNAELGSTFARINLYAMLFCVLLALGVVLG